MRNTTFIGEHARVMFKLSEALEQEPGEDAAAATFHTEAQKLLRQRLPDSQQPGFQATYDDLTSILWR